MDVAGEARHHDPPAGARLEEPQQHRPHRALGLGEAGFLGVGRVASSRRMPGSWARAPMRPDRSSRPSTGVRSSLKSPECRITPCGVWKAVANPWGTEWVTGMNSTSKGPTGDAHRRRPRRTSHAVLEPRLLDPVAGQAQREGRAVDGDRHVAQQEGEAAGVVLVAVGEHHRLDRLGVVAQVGEVGQHQVDAGHVRIGEHDAAVQDHDAPVDLDARRSCARSPRGRRER